MGAEAQYLQDIDNEQFSYSPGRVGRFFAGLPKGFVGRMGRIMGTLAFILDWRHRRIVRRNLAFAYPQWPEEKIRAVSKAIFKNAFITIIEIFQIHFSSREDVLKKVRFDGDQYLLEAVKGPKGVIVISAHLGNWEVSGLMSSIYFKAQSAFVARELSSNFLDRWLNEARTRFGNVIIDKKGALPKMVRLLRKGWLVGVLIDQGTSRAEGVESTLFGKKVFTTPVAALLARRYGCPVIPVYCPRDGEGFLSITIKPPLMLRKTDDAEADLLANVQIMNDALEEGIRANPEQWFWFHKRWKKHYPQLYPEDLARKRRKRERRREKREGGRSGIS